MMRDLLRRTVYNRSYVLDVLVAVLLIATIYFLIAEHNLNAHIQAIARQNTALNLQNKDVLGRIKSCTDPAGECYKDNAARSSAVVAQLNRASLVTAFCVKIAPPNAKVSDIEKCVATRMKSK